MNTSRPSSALRLLSQRDLRRVVQSLQDFNADHDPNEFAFRAMTMLLKIVPADGASFNRLELRSTGLLCQGYPKKSLEPLTERSRQNFLRYQHEHPFVSLFRKTGGFGPVRTTDLMNQERFERLSIYNEYYRPQGSRFQLEFTLPAPRDVCLCLVVDRVDKDFSERDRAVFTLLRPHLAVAHRAAQMDLEYQALEKCLDPHRGVAFLDAAGRLQYLTASAESLLAKYFPDDRGERMPEEITRWLKHHQQLLASDTCLGETHAPLTVTRGGDQLEVQAQRDGTRCVVLMREKQAPSSPARLVALGLTARQAEVLYWIAQGKTNAEIGTILGASHHTIHQHVNAILHKLRVENRASAMLRALEVMGLPVASA